MDFGGEGSARKFPSSRASPPEPRAAAANRQRERRKSMAEEKRKPRAYGQSQEREGILHAAGQAPNPGQVNQTPALHATGSASPFWPISNTPSNTVRPWAPASRPMDTVRPRSAHRGRARLRPPTASGARQPVAAEQVRWRRLRRCGGKPWREARPAAFLEVPCPLGPPARVVPPGSRCRRVERSSARLTGRGGEGRGAVPPWRTTSERGCRPVPHDDGSGRS